MSIQKLERFSIVILLFSSHAYNACPEMQAWFIFKNVRSYYTMSKLAHDTLYSRVSTNLKKNLN